MTLIVRKFALVLAALGVALSAPASAQIFSEQYLFLKAVEEKDSEAVQAALNTPGNTIVNSRDIATGETVLHIVVKRRDTPWLRFLAKRGANPNLADKNGVYPLQLAAQLGFADGVKALLDNRARVDVTNDAGETPLIFAVHRRDHATMRVLLEGGADPDRADSSGRSAREYARLQGGQGGTLSVIEQAESENGPADVQIYGPSF